MKPTAIIFPGQGSQSLGMLKDLAAEHAVVKEVFATASSRVNYDVWELVQSGPEDKLNQTEYTQVAMLAADVAVYEVLNQKCSISVNMMAGHSLGEYAALVCSGAIGLEDAAYLVSQRGQIMQKAIPLGKGAMAAIIGMTDEQVQDICQEVSSPEFKVIPANYNAVGQVVIAGDTFAVEQAVERANTKGARMAKLIPVSVPCHCPLLEEAAKSFAVVLDETPLKKPTIPVISNVDLSVYGSVEQIRILLAQQLYQPVRWVETIQKMKQLDIELVIESGPGKVLSGLVKRIDRSIQAISVNDPVSLESLQKVINE